MILMYFLRFVRSYDVVNNFQFSIFVPLGTPFCLMLMLVIYEEAIFVFSSFMYLC